MRRGEVGAETAQPGATPRVQFVPRQVSLEGKARHATRAQKRPYARVATCCSPTVPRSARSRHKIRDKVGGGWTWAWVLFLCPGGAVCVPARGLASEVSAAT